MHRWMLTIRGTEPMKATWKGTLSHHPSMHYRGFKTPEGTLLLVECQDYHMGTRYVSNGWPLKDTVVTYLGEIE